jgi:hypothetical protein
MNQQIMSYNEWVKSREPEAPVNEDLETWLHGAVDVISAVADSVVPGSGAVVDVIHAISYFAQAKLSQPNERVALNLQGIITLASVALIGPLQAAATALKNELKIVFDAFKKGATGSTINLAKGAVGNATAHANSILKSIADVAKWLGSKLREVANTEVGKWFVQKFGSIDKAVAACSEFLTVEVPASIKEFLTMLAKLNPTLAGAAGSETTELAVKQVSKNWAAAKVAGGAGKTIADVTQRANGQIAQLNQTKNSNSPQQAVL